MPDIKTAPENTPLEKEPVQPTPAAAPVDPSPSRLDDFAKTSTAAKMSGVFHETVGSLKNKFGEMTDDAALKDAGKNQRLLGKVHRFVGTLRGVREAASEKLVEKRIESLAICRKDGERALDVASDFVEDMKKLFLK